MRRAGASYKRYALVKENDIVAKLKKEREQIEKTFNTLQRERQQLQQQLIQLDTKLIELRGQHTLLNELLNEKNE